MKLVEAEELTKHFPLGTSLLFSQKEVVHAVDEISFAVEEGETLALVGESGCGKTTVGRLVLRLIEPTSGVIRFNGRNIVAASDSAMRELRPQMQIIFQDPFASLNPRKTIRQILSQPFQTYTDLSKKEVEKRVTDLLENSGLVPPKLYLDRHPHEFSGGQRQRIVVARAIALQPKFVVADEPVSALDLSVRAQILKLMRRLQDEFRVTFLFISHDLAVVRSMANMVAVMYLGKIVEVGSVEEIFKDPLHPYTIALLSAVPIPRPRLAKSKKRIILQGDVPSPIDPPRGCRFHTRCPFKRDDCTRDPAPLLLNYGDGHLAACPYVQEIKREIATAIRP